MIKKQTLKYTHYSHYLEVTPIAIVIFECLVIDHIYDGDNHSRTALLDSLE